MCLQAQATRNSPSSGKQPQSPPAGVERPRVGGGMLHVHSCAACREWVFGFGGRQPAWVRYSSGGRLWRFAERDLKCEWHDLVSGTTCGVCAAGAAGRGWNGADGENCDLASMHGLWACAHHRIWNAHASWSRCGVRHAHGPCLLWLYGFSTCVQRFTGSRLILAERRST